MSYHYLHLEKENQGETNSKRWEQIEGGKRKKRKRKKKKQKIARKRKQNDWP
jgi:hypothetical protein